MREKNPARWITLLQVRWIGVRWIGAVLGVLIAAMAPATGWAADSSLRVTLDATKTTPRAVEPLTQRSVLRDYKFAWANLAEALESNSTSPLNGLFVGEANSLWNEKIASQRENGLSSRYLNQNHKLEAVFYAPEGDVIELHDTAEYDLELLDSGKTVHSQHAVVHYVVLMTPGADRWVIRELQSVPQF
jgi:hypothetical protein